MTIIFTISILFILTVSLFLDIKKNNKRFWAFVFFFQHVPLIIFDKLGNENIGLIYFALMFLIFLFKNEKIIISHSRLTSPIAISLLLLIVPMFFHYFVIGIDPANVMGNQTFMRVLTFNIPIVLICLFMIKSDSKTFIEIMDGTILYGFFFLLTVFFVSGLAEVSSIDRTTFRDDFRINPLVAAKTAGIIILATFFKIINCKKLRIRIPALIVLGMAFLLIFITASRAALLFLFVVLAIYYLMSSIQKSKKIIIISSSILLGIILYSIAVNLNLEILERLQGLNEYDDMLRYTRFQIIFDMILDFKMGFWGYGPFGFGHITGLNYPHNYIAESIVDYGVLGTLSVLLMTVFGLYYSLKQIRRKDHYSFAFIALVFIYAFLTSQTSGDIVYAMHIQFTAVLLANAVIQNKFSKKLSNSLSRHNYSK